MAYVPISPEDAIKPRKDGKPRKTNNRASDAPGGRKATDAEIESRVEYCAHLIGVKLLAKYSICAAMRKKYGLCDASTCQLYIPRAQKLLRSRSSMTPEAARDIGLAHLLDIAKKAPPPLRLRVEMRLAEIYGYNAPRRHELSGPDGGPIQAESGPLPPMTRERLLALVAAAEADIAADKEQA